MNNEDTLINYVVEICNKNSLGKVWSCKRQNIGFNRAVYNINNMYIIKICINSEKELGIINEIQYYIDNPNYFNPKLITYDTSKETIPYIYTIEEKISGNNLFNVWGSLNESQREHCLNKLVQILKKIHKPTEQKNEAIANMLLKYDEYLNSIKLSKIISSDKIYYLSELRNIFASYFENASFGFTHGDIHFNNIIYSDDGLKLIDFECCGIAPLDKDFDSINRMVRNPNNLIKKGLQSPVNPKDYDKIMYYLVQYYPEVCQVENFENRLLVYDCINSLKWLNAYPEHKLYHDILFTESKKLIK
ncbi:MAG: hypothetical protein E7166_05180 [Firmicutes bacterium]|nr:hypothetical protein [Bacillota bacterium]